MKHHFADFLDRSGGHWNFTPNVERFQYEKNDLAVVPKSASILTVTKVTKNWERLKSLPNLIELTLHEPSKEQLTLISELWNIKRLRITHARPKTIDFLSRLQNLEELVLEYVSGFEDISPIGDLKKLTALHIENVRRISDFSALAGASKLEYLGVLGTLDWKQPIVNFNFLGGLQNLEYLRIMFAKSLAETPALGALRSLRKLKKIQIPENMFDLEDYAALAVHLDDVEGANRPPYRKLSYGYVELPADDIRSKLSLEVLEANHPEVFVRYDGKREVADPSEEWIIFLGKGVRQLKSRSAKAMERCATHSAAYDTLKEKYRSPL